MPERETFTDADRVGVRLQEEGTDLEIWAELNYPRKRAQWAENGFGDHRKRILVLEQRIGDLSAKLNEIGAGEPPTESDTTPTPENTG